MCPGLLTPSFKAAQFRIMQKSIVFQKVFATAHRPRASRLVFSGVRGMRLLEIHTGKPGFKNLIISSLWALVHGIMRTWVVHKGWLFRVLMDHRAGVKTKNMVERY
jgi:hypothetical protein